MTYYYAIFENPSGDRIKRELTQSEYESLVSISRFDSVESRLLRWGLNAPGSRYRLLCAAAGPSVDSGNKSVKV